jgi:predicted DNA binding CopG/RHH family protein
MHGKAGDMKRQVPRLTTDEEAEAFLEQDLSDLDFGQFKRTRFKFGETAVRPKRRGAAKTRSSASSVPVMDPVHSKSHK